MVLAEVLGLAGNSILWAVSAHVSLAETRAIQGRKQESCDILSYLQKSAMCIRKAYFYG